MNTADSTSAMPITERTLHASPEGRFAIHPSHVTFDRFNNDDRVIDTSPIQHETKK
jgi:hypothetical protein